MYNFRLQKIKLKFKHLIDNIAINLWSSEKICKHGRYKTKMQTNCEFIKTHIQ